MSHRVGILVFDEVEVLDACGPFEVFSVASRLGGGVFDCRLVGARSDQSFVTARGGMRLLTDHTLDDSPDFDLLLVPGGMTTTVEKSAEVLAWLRARRSTPVIASVCTGVFLLAASGLVTDQTVTTHWEDQAELAARFPALTVVGDRRWVGAGPLWTSAGISAGLDLSLELVAHLAGRDVAERTARQMDYEWRRDPSLA